MCLSAICIIIHTTVARSREMRVSFLAGGLILSKQPSCQCKLFIFKRVHAIMPGPSFPGVCFHFHQNMQYYSQLGLGSVSLDAQRSISHPWTGLPVQWRSAYEAAQLCLRSLERRSWRRRTAD